MSITNGHYPESVDPVETLDSDVRGFVYADGFDAVIESVAMKGNQLYFLSMVGQRETLKAICARIITEKGARIQIGSDLARIWAGRDFKWTYKVARLPGTNVWHGVVYSRVIETDYIRKEDDWQGFVMLAFSDHEAITQHHTLLSLSVATPLIDEWAQWTWDRAWENGEIVAMTCLGIKGYVCDPDEDALRSDISKAIRNGELTAGTSILN